MPKHPIVHIEISSKDREKAAQFYSSVFGWRTEQIPEMNYATFDTEAGLQGGFNPVNDENPAGTVLVYIGSEDIDADLQSIEKAGGKMIVPKTVIPQTGWYGIFEDPSGNRLGLYTPMKTS